jgi:hypothetical protein
MFTAIGLKRAYEKAGSLKELSRRYKYSSTHMGRILKKHGVTYRHNCSKGYKTKNAEGYVLVLCKGHLGGTKGGYVYEHRLVMEAVMGRVLRTNEHVHHKNGDRADNRIENLELKSAGSHVRDHLLGRTWPKCVKQKERVEQLRRSGFLCKEIAKIVGLCEPTILKLLVGFPSVCSICGKKCKRPKGLGMHFRRAHRGPNGS